MAANTEYDELMAQIKVVKDRVRAVVYGLATAFYLYGRPGTAKTYLIRTTLDALGVRYVYLAGHITPRALFDHLAENPDGILVLDDVSWIFHHDVARQILLAALGAPPDGSNVRVVEYRTARQTMTVRFTGGIICLSNLPLERQQDEVRAALQDRAFVLHFDPTDEQISAMINKLADDGVRGVPPARAREVATFLLEQCRRLRIRPSVRLFVDKALADFKLWAEGKSEVHWRDLVLSNLHQELIALHYPTTDRSRDEQLDAERRIAVEIASQGNSREERLRFWHERTGKSSRAYYRRLKEAQAAARGTATASTNGQAAAGSVKVRPQPHRNDRHGQSPAGADGPALPATGR
jgi:hypothetical protein